MLFCGKSSHCLPFLVSPDDDDDDWWMDSDMLIDLGGKQKPNRNSRTTGLHFSRGLWDWLSRWPSQWIQESWAEITKGPFYLLCVFWEGGRMCGHVCTRVWQWEIGCSVCPWCDCKCVWWQLDLRRGCKGWKRKLECRSEGAARKGRRPMRRHCGDVEWGRGLRSDGLTVITHTPQSKEGEKCLSFPAPGVSALSSHGTLWLAKSNPEHADVRGGGLSFYCVLPPQQYYSLSTEFSHFISFLMFLLWNICSIPYKMQWVMMDSTVMCSRSSLLFSAGSKWPDGNVP